MKILVFTEGTILVHASSKGKTREEIVKQSAKFGIQMENLLSTLIGKPLYKKDPGGIHNYANYIPLGEAVKKINKWKNQGAEIYYLTSRRIKQEMEAIQKVLEKNGFPDFQNLLFRAKGGNYKDVAERLMPDIFIEDDCESIGGAREMTSTHFSQKAKKEIKTIIVKEFQGIDHLPDDKEIL